MKNYKVTIAEQHHYSIAVKAAGEFEAGEIVEKKWDNGKGRNAFSVEEVSGCDVVSTEQVSDKNEKIATVQDFKDYNNKMERALRDVYLFLRAKNKENTYKYPEENLGDINQLLQEVSIIFERKIHQEAPR
jgi:hypothetical protein